MNIWKAMKAIKHIWITPILTPTLCVWMVKKKSAHTEKERERTTKRERERERTTKREKVSERVLM